MIDNKYVVFKREDWERYGELAPSVAVEDAVVIRLQDIFAGSALHAYASSVQTALEILEAQDVILGGDVVARMVRTRDYFFNAALEADDHRSKKVPD